MENLLYNTGPGAKFAFWTPTVTGAAATPLGTFSATSGPDSTPGVTLSATGTSGGIEAVGKAVNVAAETMLGLSVVLAASSVTPTLIPIQATFKDAAGNTVVTVTPYASAVPASTSAIQYNATVGVPVGAATANVIFGALAWASVGGYSVIMSSPIVLGF